MVQSNVRLGLPFGSFYAHLQSNPDEVIVLLVLWTRITAKKSKTSVIMHQCGEPEAAYNSLLKNELGSALELVYLLQ